MALCYFDVIAAFIGCSLDIFLSCPRAKMVFLVNCGKAQSENNKLLLSNLIFQQGENFRFAHLEYPFMSGEVRELHTCFPFYYVGVPPKRFIVQARPTGT